MPQRLFIEIGKNQHINMPSNELYLIYKINEHAIAVVDTPEGFTNCIELTEIVRQGSMYGPILCNLSTDKINEINKPITELITPEVGLSVLVFVGNISE